MAAQALDEPTVVVELGTGGHLLFRDPAFARQPIEACRYPAALLPAAVRAEGLWGRRSLFCQGALGVLVAEVFLPALWQADAAARN